MVINKIFIYSIVFNRFLPRAGIDAQASSILLGNVKCFGTENRGGNFLNNQMVGTTVPIMQFANSDIEDLNIVGDEQPTEPLPVQQPAAQQPSYSAPTIVSPPKQPTLPKQSSIHDDPAIVSAIVSSSNKDLSASNRLIHGLQQMNLSDGHSNRGSNFEGTFVCLLIQECNIMFEILL